MTRVAQPEKLSGLAILERIPRVWEYVASVMEAEGRDDAGYTVEMPRDLPMDEATFCALIFTTTELADAAGLTPNSMREQAAKMRLRDATHSTVEIDPSEATGPRVSNSVDHVT